MQTLKVTSLGNSLGVILPKEILARLHVKKGDAIHVIETPDGYELTAHDPEFAAQMEIAEEGMRLYRNTLRELAK